MRRAAISFAESALTDLEAVIAWYEEQGAPEAGHRLVGAVLERVEALAAHPDLGRVVPEFGQAYLRELVEPPFRIVYRHDRGRDRGRVRVVRVWHSERTLRLP